MADGLFGGYKVGLISASLHSKSKEKGRNKEEKTKTLFFSSSFTLPNFVPVVKKKPGKDLDLAVQKEARKTERKSDKEEGKETKRKTYLEDEPNLETARKKPNVPVNKSAHDDPERLARTIFVGNLPITTSRKDLKKFFKKYGDVETTRLRSVAVPDLQTPKKVAIIKKQFNPNRNNVNGYVVFKNKESAEKALLSNGSMIGDLHIRVDRVGGEGKQYDHKRSVFVGNLIFDIKEEDLSDLFARCGEVQGVRIIRDPNTGIGKGFGYVLFQESSSVSLALKMNNAELCGRKIRVQPSQDKSKSFKGATKQGSGPKNFSGVQAKEKSYHKRKALKQQKNFGLSNPKKNQSKTNKHDKRTAKPINKKKS